MRHVFVTGGSRGIGAAIVRDLMARGSYQVTFTYQSRLDLAEALMDELGRPDHLRAVAMDLRNKDSIRAALAKALGDGPGFDIVVHNAAYTADAPFFFLEEQDWESVIATSLNSFFHINKACLPHMIEKRWGRIIVMASVSGEAGQRGQTNYAAAKGALIAASKSLAREVARKGVLVNAVSPGLIETDMTHSIPVAEVLPMIPVGRFGKPEEVAKVVAFLASDDASYINGTVLQVNGGLYT